MNEKRPELGGRFLRLMPPMSSDVQVFSGGLTSAVGRGTSAAVPVVEAGLSSIAPGGDAVGEPSPLLLESAVGSFTFGLVMGMADLVTLREAIALARARW